MGTLKLALSFLIIILLAWLCGASTQPTAYAASSGEDWPMFRHDPAHTGYTTSTAPTTTPVVVWSLGPKGDLLTSPAIVDGVVYVSGHDLFAFNASTGETIWSVVNGGYSSPVVTGGVVYTGIFGGTAFNASTGAQIWNASQELGYVDSLTVANGYAYSSPNGANGVMRALNATTGAEIWSKPAGLVVSISAIVDGYLYIGFTEGVYALNASTGAKIWNYTTYSVLGYGVHSSPAVADGVVYVGSDDGNLYAFDAFTGAKMWNYTMQPRLDEYGNPQYMRSSPAVANGNIYMSSYDHIMIVLGTASSPTLPPSPSPTPSGSSTTPEFLNQVLGITFASIIVVASLVLIRKKWMKKESQQK